MDRGTQSERNLNRPLIASVYFKVECWDPLATANGSVLSSGRVSVPQAGQGMCWRSIQETGIKTNIDNRTGDGHACPKADTERLTRPENDPEAVTPLPVLVSRQEKIAI